jgi:hypothetical protein
MRIRFKFMAMVAAPLLISNAAAVAQTGEFAATVPGEVVHRGYALQDELQRVRNIRPASRPVETAARKPRMTRPESQQIR